MQHIEYSSYFRQTTADRCYAAAAAATAAVHVEVEVGPSQLIVQQRASQLLCHSIINNNNNIANPCSRLSTARG